MYKVFIIIVTFLFLVSCSKKEELKSVPVPPDPSRLTAEQAMKIIGDATGRHDSILFLYCCVVDLDGDHVFENVIVSEMISDPNPMVSVYFSKKDTLFFVPVPALSGTMPEISLLALCKDKPDQLGVRYTMQDDSGCYSYRFAAYQYYKESSQVYKNNQEGLKELIDLQLYKIQPDGKIIDAEVCEIHETENPTSEICLYDAKVEEERSESYLNKGPMLVKKSDKPNAIFSFRYHDEYSIWNRNIIYVGGPLIAKIKPGENY